MSELGSLTVSLAANTAKFTQDLGKAAHEARKSMKEITAAIASAAEVTVALGAAAATSAALYTKNFANAADMLAKMAQRAGVAVDSLSALQYAGKLSDVSMQSLGTALQQLNKSIDENDPAFKRLGISLTDSSGRAKSTEQVLREVANRFAGMADGADKTKIAMDLLGKSGAELIPMLNGGADGLDRMRREAERFGVVVTNDVAKAAEEFNDNLTRLRASAEGLAQTFAAPLIPELADLTGRMVAAAKAAGSFAGGLAGMFLTDTEEPALKIQELTAKIERLRQTRDELAKPSFANKLNDVIFGDVGDLDRQIAAAEKEIQFLQKLQAELVGGYYDMGQKPFQAAPADDGKAAAQAARRVAEAERERARALNESFKAAQDMARVEIESGQELAALRAKWAAEERELMAAATESAFKDVASIRESLMTEEQLLTEHYLNKQDQLVAARDLEVITQEEYDQLMQDMEADHWVRLGEIRKRGLTDIEKFSALSFRKQSENITGMLSDMTAVVARENRAMFEINKVAGIANVALKAQESIANSYKFGTEWGGPVAGAAMAAIAIAATAAQIAAINGTSYGGGGGAGSAPSIAGSTAAQPVSPVQGGTPGGQGGGGATTILNIQGESISRKQIREIVDMLNETMKDGGRIVFA